MIKIFGYVTPLKPELKIREFEAYKAFYCGVCKEIGKNFGQLPRFGLINETACLAIILTVCSRQDTRLTLKHDRCIAHPIRRRIYASDSQAITYAACVNVLLEYHKLMDSYYDNKNVLSKSGAFAIKRAYKKARRFSPILSDFIEIYMKDQLTLEKNKCCSLDEACEPTAKMLAEIFTWKDNVFFDNDPVMADNLNTFGYNLGKWIYIVDAVSDVCEDKKKNQYNVLLEGNNYYDCDSQKLGENIIFTMNMCLANAANAWENIKKAVYNNENSIKRDLFAIIDNLVYLGMRNVSEKVTGGQKSERPI